MSTFTNALDREVYLIRVEPGRFEVAYSTARATDARLKASTSDFQHDGNVETFYYLLTDNAGGFCVRADGELVYVFSTVKGRGDLLVRAAVERGARHLDCFAGYLVTLYSRHGFGTVRRIPNWTEGEPDVVYMQHHRNLV